LFSFQDRRGPVEVAFTDRHGGVSDGPYASLNLSVPKGADSSDPVGEREGVLENIDLVAHALARGGEVTGGRPFAVASAPVVVTMNQVHGGEVHTADRRWMASRPAEPPVADGLVTDVPGVALLVRVADCVPVVLADPDRGVVGCAHAGRPGLVARVVPHTLARMRDLGAERIVAWVGPHVCGRCYEVPDEMRAEVSKQVPESYAETSWGTAALDVGAGVRAQLVAEGAEVVDASRCTMEHDDLYSYRRQGTASGRFGGLVWVRP
jgi:YfiH family protein